MKYGAKKINYGEGARFFVPLQDGGFARGIVARLDGRGQIFAYFFGPRLSHPADSFDDLRAQDAILSGLCGDLGLLRGVWPRAGEPEAWERRDWPLPALYREDESQRQAWLSRYDENSLSFICETPVEFRAKQFVDYPYDRLMGYKAVEIRLSKLL